MDSGNSSSMQSSGGGDEEYDSRSESISASFLNSTGQINPFSTQPQPPVPHSSSLFDPLSNYLAAFPRPSPPISLNPLLNLDVGWSRGLSSDPNCTGIRGPISSSLQSVPLVTAAPAHDEQQAVHSTNKPNAAARNSRKRSRASRRAPTTVLTTDTSNFRAMVQEFTGVPEQPYAPLPAVVPYPRFDPILPPNYLLRPFAEKLQLSSRYSLPLGFSSSLHHPANVQTAANSTSTQSCQIPSSGLLDLQNQHQRSLFTIQTPPPRYPLPNLPIFGEKSPNTTPAGGGETHLKMGRFMEEFVVDQGHVPSHMNSLVPGRIRSDENLRSSREDLEYSKLASKTNSSAASSDFHAEKSTPENVSPRGEGIVDSWIFSTD